ncbi:MAG: TlpA disulfide reductase family protein [Pseudomonadota bacterium]
MMTKTARDRFTFLAIACVLVAAGWLWLSPTGARAAPSVTFTTLKGERVDIATLRGKPLLVNFWATTCIGCVAEMPHLAELYREFEPNGFEIVGVAMYYDPPNQVLELTRQREVPYPISLDVDGQIGKAFGDVSLTPTSFLIDSQGKIVFHKIGELDMDLLHGKIESMLHTS